jgi:hypothetical protein
MQIDQHGSNHPARIGNSGRMPDTNGHADAIDDERRARHEDPSKQPGASERWMKSFPGRRPTRSGATTKE